MYHGTTAQQLMIEDGMDLCLAYDVEIARAYNSAVVFSIELADGRIADESGVWDVAAELDDVYEMDHYEQGDWRRQYVYELLDRDDVREALADAGYDAVRYEDLSPDNEHTHDTLRVWSASLIASVTRI